MEVGHRVGHGGGPDLVMQVVDEGSHTAKSNAVGRKLQEIERMVFLGKAEPASIGGFD